MAMLGYLEGFSRLGRANSVTMQVHLIPANPSHEREVAHVPGFIPDTGEAFCHVLPACDFPAGWETLNVEKKLSNYNQNLISGSSQYRVCRSKLLVVSHILSCGTLEKHVHQVYLPHKFSIVRRSHIFSYGQFD